MDTGRLITRLTIGSLFVGHGTQKLFGLFGGDGLEGTAENFERLGLRPGRRHALGAGIAETAGGVLLAVGLLTPLAASVLTGVKTTAIRKVHAKNGIWVTEGGVEYPAVIVAALAGLVEVGPGRSSLDARLFPRMRGLAWAASSIVAGAAGSLLNESLLVEPGSPQPQSVAVPAAEARGPASVNEHDEPSSVGAGIGRS